MPHKLYIGIDNGTSGSIGWLGDGIDTGFAETPKFEEQSYTKTAKDISRIDRKGLRELVLKILGENKPYEAIAILEDEIQKGYGKQLLAKVLEEIKLLNGDNIYLVAKEPIFFRKNGFKEIDKNKAPDFSCCFACPDYKVSCFPIAMKYLGEK